MFAKLINNVVFQVILADAEFVKTLDGDWVEVNEGTGPADIGFSYENGKFIPLPLNNPSSR